MSVKKKFAAVLGAATVGVSLVVAAPMAANAESQNDAYYTCGQGTSHYVSVPFRLVAGRGSGVGVIVFENVNQRQYDYPASRPGVSRKSFSVYRPGNRLRNINVGRDAVDIYGSTNRICAG
ncbi:hypothetical protein [Microbacterium sp. BH-3-3-3]|uniref:hypothetical protein n=1 Tax=Microbacterium sp. BH-3-3-3 TaxID=1906742 RepID=UPI0012EA61D0|nr:hypothetical protein [Microbacterium sp. BH-3-3-3]